MEAGGLTLGHKLAQDPEDLEGLLPCLARRIDHRIREQTIPAEDEGTLARSVSVSPESEVLASELLRDEGVELERGPET